MTDPDANEVDEPTIALDHPRFRIVWASIFTRQLVADCMTHRCAMVEASDQPHREKLDACCQYGCDVDLDERDRILERADDIRALLRPAAQSQRWFELDEEVDPDYPSGKVVRTEVFDEGCIFLAHDRRGCAIHRASLENGWDLRGVKPAICRLFPLSYEADAIVIADEYAEYSCAHVAGPTLYRITRDTLGELFGSELVAELDRAERTIRANRPRKLATLR